MAFENEIYCNHIFSSQYSPHYCELLSEEERQAASEEPWRCPDWGPSVCACGCKGAPICLRKPGGKLLIVALGLFVSPEAIADRRSYKGDTW